MTRVILEGEVLDDIDRFLDHHLQHDILSAEARIQRIVDTLQVLEGGPHLGRPTPDGFRELVIGSGARGYIALYAYDPKNDVVYIPAARSRKEAGCKRG